MAHWHRRIQTVLLLILCLMLCGCKNKAAEYRMLGIEHLEKGQYREAVTKLNEALENSRGKLSEEKFDILLYRAEAEYMQGLYDDCQATLSMLKEAAGEQEAVAALQRQLDAKRLIEEASHALDRGDAATAGEKLEAARAAGLAADRDLEFNTMVYLEKTAKWEEALEAAQNYLARYPGDKEAEKELAFLRNRVDGLRSRK